MLKQITITKEDSSVWDSEVNKVLQNEKIVVKQVYRFVNEKFYTAVIEYASKEDYISLVKQHKQAQEQQGTIPSLEGNVKKKQKDKQPKSFTVLN